MLIRNAGRRFRLVCRGLSVALCVFILALAACSSAPSKPDELNVVERSESISDPTPYGDEAAATPFEFRSLDATTVGVNFRRRQVEDSIYYWVRVFLRNDTGTTRSIIPQLTMLDADGAVVPVVPRDALVAYVDEISRDDGRSTGVYVHGATRAAGTAAALTGLHPAAAAIGLLGPFAGEAARSGEYANGARLAQWALTHWLAESYDLPPGASATGLVAFSGPRTLPLRLRIEVDDGVAEFVTREE